MKRYTTIEVLEFLRLRDKMHELNDEPKELAFFSKNTPEEVYADAIKLPPELRDDRYKGFLKNLESAIKMRKRHG